MATEEVERKAKEAFVDDNFDLAVDLYTQAIGLNPKSAHLFSDRAQSNIKLNNFTEAVADTNKAIDLDPSMAKAYLRKGTACIKLEEYQTAKAALEVGASLAQNDVRFTKLIKECDEHIAEESQSLIPKVPAGVEPASVRPQSFYKTTLETAGARQSTSHQMNELVSIKPKYRHEYYQKPEEVAVTIFAKGVAATDVVVDFGEQILSVTIDVRDENAYHFQSRLFGKIIPDKCRYELLSTKIEIRLAKAEAINWASLEFKEESTVLKKVNVSSVESHRPTYPSSKPRSRDWDKLEAQVKEEEKDEKLDGDAAVNKLFRDIYQNADEDMRRAMSKSFVESNGTVLSTNWSEVGAKKIEGSPPQGMEMRKWEH